MSNDHTSNTIDLELAKRFLQNPDSFDLSEAASITNEAKEMLSKHEVGFGLDGLMELSDAAAESFSKHEGEFFYLDGLTGSPPVSCPILLTWTPGGWKPAGVFR